MSGELLRTGQVVLTVNSRQPCVVMKFLGGGGQGEVYAVELSGKPMAVKWYFPYTATKEQWESLRRLVTNGPPGGSEKFLWPIELVHAENVNGFGYLMPLRAQRYKGIQDMMSGRQDASFQVLTTAGFQLVESFRILHGQGLCYRDISFGNAFFDPITGDVLVCDNDNVGPNRTKSTIMGTPHFMAPELVRGEANPDRQTDLHSLAVLLFYMFHIHNPLYGKRMLNIRCLDASAITMLCGMEPLFIFDPKDNSNEAGDDPETGANAKRYWPLYPKYLRDAFTKAFTSGLRDREHGRVTEGEWRDLLLRLRDGIYYCFACDKKGLENFFDPEAFEKSGGNSPPCCKCKSPVSLPFRLQFGRSVVMLTHQTKLFPHHLDPRRTYDFSTPAAEVVRHPQMPNRWGLKNLTSENWQVDSGNGEMKCVEPARSVTLTPNIKINFGRLVADLLY